MSNRFSGCQVVIFDQLSAFFQSPGSNLPTVLFGEVSPSGPAKHRVVGASRRWRAPGGTNSCWTKENEGTNNQGIHRGLRKWRFHQSPSKEKKHPKIMQNQEVFQQKLGSYQQKLEA